MRIYIESTVTIFTEVGVPTIGPELEALGDVLMDDVVRRTEASDMTADVAANLASGEVTFCVALEADSADHAVQRTDALIAGVMASAGVVDEAVTWQQTLARPEELIPTG